jgi:predicted transcriptional regulator
MRAILCLILTLCLSAHAQAYKIQSTLRVSEDVSVTCHGNAFAVAKNQIVTCAHVIGPGATHRAQISGKWYAATVVRRDDDNDICLLRVDGVELTPVEFAPPAQAVTIGAERNLDLKEHEVEIVGGKLKSSYSVGISGSPVLSDGKLIGMVVSVDSVDKPTRSHFVSSMVIRKFLGE